MGLIYKPNSLIERRMEYERIREEQREREAAWERGRLRRLAGKGASAPERLGRPAPGKS